MDIRQARDTDSLLGRRVRIAGWCSRADPGGRVGSWILSDSSASIEVRGRVPSSCSQDKQLTIFAQIEPTSGESSQRLLLRLPD